MQISTTIKKVAVERSSGEDFSRLTVDIEIGVSNRGDKPRIVVGRALQVVGIRIARSREEMAEQNYLLDQYHLPSFKDEAILSGLTVQSPDVHIVLPNAVGYEKIRYWTTLPEPFRHAFSKKVWLQLDVAFFPMNTMGMEGKGLQKAWTDRGEVILETITTAPIEVRLTLPRTS